MCWLPRSLIAIGVSIVAVPMFAQAVRIAPGTHAVPYSGQLKSDPAVGNVQGIQRFGRALKTDPDQGEGFSYHVYPVTQTTPLNPPLVVTTTGIPLPSNSRDSPQISATDAARLAEEERRFGGLRKRRLSLKSRLQSETDGIKKKEIETQLRDIEDRLRSLGDPQIDADPQVLPTPRVADGPEDNVAMISPQAGYAAGLSVYAMPGYSGYPAPVIDRSASGFPPAYDWTAGIRNGAGSYPRSMAASYGPYPAWPTSTGDYASLVPLTFADAVDAKGIAVTRAGLTYTTPQIYHQPLIQIKLRVIEVSRANGTSASSVLEYVSRANSTPSLTTGNPLNNNFENTRGITRFGVTDLISNASTGTGMLVNLTSEHINLAASLLATEFQADIVTAPELVTLNGENVEFLAGEKVPFDLGQNVIQGNSNNIQQVFYKHVGTLVSVTPRIVNWGLYGEGGGGAPFVNDDIADWNLLVEWLVLHLGHEKICIGVGDQMVEYMLATYTGSGAKPVPISVRSQLMTILSNYSKRDLIARGFPVSVICTDDACAWTPSDCTIDLSVVVRLSSAGAGDANPDGDTNLAGLTKESNVRAVANVVQIKSGHGVVMAGLIGEREIRNTAKVPVLGDLPYVGAAFRSRGTSRVKTEVLIFAEATVLPSDPQVARHESARDYRLSANYVNASALDHPLECNLYRSGIAPLMGRCSPAEQFFWRDCGRRVRSACAQSYDIFH